VEQNIATNAQNSGQEQKQMLGASEVKQIIQEVVLADCERKVRSANREREVWQIEESLREFWKKNFTEILVLVIEDTYWREVCIDII
jgi:hypothetical protein